MAQESSKGIEGVEILNYEKNYQVIFKTQQGGFSSFYLNKNLEQINEYQIFKKYIFLTFNLEKNKGYLLQFEDNSIFIIYKDKRVKFELWREHNSDKRETSLWYSISDYLKLFNLLPKKNSF
ncbi:hypothetical protein GGR32_002219 [Mesonia hippocampi]|uniref:Uncharacterized protein n=1 Tax=Mesonia hippocampi TaxID=1628250 RepID=A0A840EYL4_9FLAO|nr:hypothetical protein [Mesonia hippocampi]